ncbi:MAG: hypothetical protein KF855_02000 [Acidobacteria bacterium]|nr:hypothetical protein [Acidobacteriota bacterium]
MQLEEFTLTTQLCISQPSVRFNGKILVIMQTLEAIIETSGTVKLLAELKVSKRSRALVTILDEDPKDVSKDAKKSRLITAFKKASKAGAFKNIDNPVEWQRKLRNEWD